MPAQPILIIEDEHALGTALSFIIRRIGHLPTLVASGAAGLEAMKNQAFAAVVLDIGLPDVSGLQVLQKMRDRKVKIPVLVITAHATLDHAIAAQKLGATEYLTKPLDLRQFEQTIGALLARSMTASEPGVPAPAVQAATLIGAAPCLREVFVGIARACAGDVSALITGPSGSGKTLAAAVIHAHGQRASEPLEYIDCASLQDTAELEQKGKGTVVLEGLSQLSPALQSKTAAWLATSSGERPRLLATMTGDPREAVSSGVLRPDLYYAFSTLTIPMPALRERTGDIPALSSFFLGLRGNESSQLTSPVLAALQAYSWPGNVRELRHVLEYAVSVARGGPLFLSHLPAHVAASGTTSGGVLPSSGELDATMARWLDAQLNSTSDETVTYDAMLDQIEAVMLRHLLNRYEGKPTHLAGALRMNRATLRQKLRRVGLQKDDHSG